MNLAGKKGLIVGIANAQSIAFGCARAFRDAGAELAITYLNEKAQPHVIAAAKDLKAQLILPCDVRIDGQLETVFDTLRREWGTIDFVLHSIAYAPREDLHGRVTDCSADGFHIAMGISCYSFIHMTRLAEPLMPHGGCMMTVTFYGAEKVVEHYNIMGPVKSALESVTRYLAAELGPKKIRVCALSPGPIETRAASGLDRFDELLEKARTEAPSHCLVSIDDVGKAAAFLASDDARHITGTVTYIDGGHHIMA